MKSSELLIGNYYVVNHYVMKVMGYKHNGIPYGWFAPCYRGKLHNDLTDDTGTDSMSSLDSSYEPASYEQAEALERLISKTLQLKTRDNYLILN